MESIVFSKKNPTGVNATQLREICNWFDLSHPGKSMEDILSTIKASKHYDEIFEVIKRLKSCMDGNTLSDDADSEEDAAQEEAEEEEKEYEDDLCQSNRRRMRVALVLHGKSDRGPDKILLRRVLDIANM